jgi:magnesium transporter
MSEATPQLDLFLGKNYRVTYRTESIPAVDRMWAACQRDVRHLQKGASRLLYKLTAELVADYMPTSRRWTRPSTMSRTRSFANQREVLNKLARGDYGAIDEGDRVFFRDVYDHLVRMYDISEGLRDLVGGALDIYLSVVSNRMNEVMRALTVITTLFLPVSFLVGFFGTNFFQPVVPLPAWTGRTAFGLMLLAMVVLPTGMFLWIRKRAWM